MTNSYSSSPRTRWWPALVTLAAGAAALTWVWTFTPDRTGQERVYMTMAVVLGMLILLGVWLALFSALSRRTRVRALVIILAMFALAAGTVRVRGVTGDLVPIFEWRWTGRSSAELEALPVPSSESAAAPAPVASPPPVSAPPPTAAPSSAPTPVAAPSASADPKPSMVPERDYPQFLGPDRNGTVPAIDLVTDWSRAAPKIVWRRRVGAGWSGFAVAGSTAVTQEQRGDKEMVVAYNVADGTLKWAHGDDAHYQTTVAGEGPRATPTIDRGRVFTLGSTGILNAFDLATGKRIWRRDINADHSSSTPSWGRSSSPLVVDDLVIVSAGGTAGHALVAYNRDTGTPVWNAGTDEASYSSPLLATLAGVPQILMLNHATVFAHDPKTGRVLWEHAWPRLQPSVAVPLVLPGDRALFSAGYGIGSRMLQISSSPGTVQATLVWESTRLKAKFTNLVYYQGFIFGLDDGVLVCLDPANGERRWKSGRYGHGQVILAGGVLIVQTEEGEIVLVDPTPDAHRELARFAVFDRKTWNPPALAGRFLLVRNDVEAACLELPRP